MSPSGIYRVSKWFQFILILVGAIKSVLENIPLRVVWVKKKRNTRDA